MTYLDHYKLFFKPQEEKVKALIEKLHADILLPIDMSSVDELSYELEVLKKLEWDGFIMLEGECSCAKDIL